MKPRRSNVSLALVVWVFASRSAGAATNREIPVDEVVPFSSEELQKVEKDAEERRVVGEDWERRLRRRINNLHCKSGVYFRSNELEAHQRLRLALGVAVGLAPLPGGSLAPRLGASGAWTVLDAGWTCDLPSLKQLRDAGLNRAIDFISQSPVLQFSLALGLDGFFESANSEGRVFARGTIGGWLVHQAYPSLDLSFGLGPVLTRGEVGVGLSLALGIRWLEFGIRNDATRSTHAWFMTFALRDFGAY